MASWKRCTTCKKDIAFEATYYLCNVSTCRRKRTGMFFCTVDCWEAHVPLMRHREAWAEEEKAPTQAQWQAEQDGEDKPMRRVVPNSGSGSGSSATPPVKGDAPRRRVVGSKPTPVPEGPREVLIVASRLKHFIRETWGMNTSEGVLQPLSEEVRRLCIKAVERAKEDGRKTLLDRDFED